MYSESKITPSSSVFLLKKPKFRENGIRTKYPYTSIESLESMYVCDAIGHNQTDRVGLFKTREQAMDYIAAVFQGIVKIDLVDVLTA